MLSLVWKPTLLSVWLSCRVRRLLSADAHAATVARCNRPGQSNLLDLDDRDGLHDLFPLRRDSLTPEWTGIRHRLRQFKFLSQKDYSADSLRKSLVPGEILVKKC
jgi:hypothetical protein